MKNNNLTIRQLKFVEEYIKNSFNGSKSYRTAFDTTNNDVAKAEAYKLLRMPKIQDAIEATEQSYRYLAREMQLDRKSILGEIKKVIQSDKTKDKLAGINILYKLKGDFAPQKQLVELDYELRSKIDYSRPSREELQNLWNKTFASM